MKYLLLACAGKKIRTETGNRDVKTIKTADADEIRLHYDKIERGNALADIEHRQQSWFDRI